MTFISKLLHMKFSTLYSHSIISQSMWLKCHKLKLISNSTQNKKKKLPWNTHDNSRVIGSLVNDAPIVGRCPKQALL